MGRRTQVGGKGAGGSVALRLGPWVLALEGLTETQAAGLRRRLGAFASAPRGRASLRIRLEPTDAGEAFLPGRLGEHYRIEAAPAAEGWAVVSYRFRLEGSRDPVWRARWRASHPEPEERGLENLLRVAVARLAAEVGGFALHGAGVAREDGAWIFAGPSGAGKTTAVSLCPDLARLGDDFALALPGPGDWCTTPLPFDNAEAAPEDLPPGTLLPLRGILGLVHDPQTRVEPVTGPAGAAVLAGSLAFPWALPDLAGELLAHVTAFVETGRFHRLYFHPGAVLSDRLP